MSGDEDIGGWVDWLEGREGPPDKLVMETCPKCGGLWVVAGRGEGESSWCNDCGAGWWWEDWATVYQDGRRMCAVGAWVKESGCLAAPFWEEA